MMKIQPEEVSFIWTCDYLQQFNSIPHLLSFRSFFLYSSKQGLIYSLFHFQKFSLWKKLLFALLYYKSLKIIINRMKQTQYYHYNFLVVGFIALLNCPDRNDYNLPLAIFAYLIWNYPHQRSQRHRALWLLIFSEIFDVIWILSVSIGFWGSLNATNKLAGMTQILSIINFCYKLILIIYALVSIEDCQNLLKWNAFKSEVLQKND